MRESMTLYNDTIELQDFSNVFRTESSLGTTAWDAGAEPEVEVALLNADHCHREKSHH